MSVDYIRLAAQDVPVLDHVNVLVVGGGPAGIGAAIGAAKAGAGKVALIERYGYLGGMATGGQVILIPSLSYENEIVLKGVIYEAVERLRKKPNGFYGPGTDITGSQDEKLARYWSNYHNMVWHDTVCYGGFTDPDIFKIVLQEMTDEAGIEYYFHCWESEAIVEDDCVKGVCFVSKQGKCAILANVVIDCTGDADVCAGAGAKYELNPVGTDRNSAMGLVYRLGGTNFDEFAEYKRANPGDWAKHIRVLNERFGYAMQIFPTGNQAVVWMDNWITNGSCIEIKSLGDAGIKVLRSIYPIIDYLHEQQIPGLKDCWFYDVAGQTGTRGSRRILAKTRLEMSDISNAKKFDDAIAVFPATNHVTTDGGVQDCTKLKPQQFPLSTLIPIELENIIVAGRAFSSDAAANNLYNLLPHCFAMGQAAGVLAACAIKSGTAPSAVPYRNVQRELINQNVYLPKEIVESL